MQFTELRAVESLFAQLRGAVREILEENETSPMTLQEVYALFCSRSCHVHFEQSNFLRNFLAAACVWAFAGPMKLYLREEYCQELVEWIRMTSDGITLPSFRQGSTLIDYEIRIEDQEFHHWDERVDRIEIKHEQVCRCFVCKKTFKPCRRFRYIFALPLQKVSVFLMHLRKISETCSLLWCELRTNDRCEHVRVCGW